MAADHSKGRASNGARDKIFTMLKEDHDRVKKAFSEFEKLDAKKDPERCREIVEHTCKELEMHAALEEEVFYPAVRDALEEEDLLEEAQVEHNSAKALIAQLKITPPQEAKYHATFTVLGEYMKHHIKEEEEEMFPQLGKAKLDWDELDERMRSRRDTLMQVYLPEQARGKTGSQKSASAR